MRKGVYIDGHEREDVKEYRSHVFLPLMKLLERHMTEWVPQPGTPELVRKDPKLNAGEKRVITVPR